MTFAERYAYLQKGYVILRARRCPKRNNWHVAYFVNPNFHKYTFREFDTREQCESHINLLCHMYTLRFVADFSETKIIARR